MKTDMNVRRFVDDYYTVGSYKIAYESPIYPIPDHDKTVDNFRVFFCF